MTLIHDPYSQSHRRLPRFLSDRRHEREPYHNLAHAERFTLESTRLCSENNLRHPLLRYIPTVRAEDPGTLNVTMNTRKSRSRASNRTSVTLGIEMASFSGSRWLPPASGLGSAAALIHGIMRKTRLTRNPRINMH